MVSKLRVTIIFFSAILLSPLSWAHYGASLCKMPSYSCLRVSGNQSWGSLFPDPTQRLIVKKVNRMNTPLHNGMIIAVPQNLNAVGLMDLAPFPHKISASHRNLVEVNLSRLAWGAYDTEGNLLNWGPVSGGKGFCPDIGKHCRTVVGTYTIFDKKGANCISSVFPVPHGGAPMPYCMHFHGGYALHGSPTVPGFNASHGCVRLFVEDALWLNHEFVETDYTKVHIVP